MLVLALIQCATQAISNINLRKKLTMNVFMTSAMIKVLEIVNF